MGNAPQHTLYTNENGQHIPKWNILVYRLGDWLDMYPTWQAITQEIPFGLFPQLMRRYKHDIPKQNFLSRHVNIFPVQYPIQGVSHFGCSSCNKVPFVLLARQSHDEYPTYHFNMRIMS
jgi:hypothetical protein